MAKKTRLDQYLVAHGLAPSRDRAKALIMAGAVLVNDTPVTKAGSPVIEGAEIRLKKGTESYASRGALKLIGALDEFNVDPSGSVCLDVGASTGGFTDVLLRRGAIRVYAVDVGYGQLRWELQSNPRVTILDRTNARYLSEEHVPELVDLVVADVSFISVTLLLAPILMRAKPEADVMVMVKPQFEVGKGHVGKGGVVRDEGKRLAAIEGVSRAAEDAGFEVLGRRDNDIRGPKGNLECFLHLRRCKKTIR